jgi:hypothetical protein
MSDVDDKVKYHAVICELFGNLKWVFVCYKNVHQLQFIAVCMSEKLQCVCLHELLWFYHLNIKI